MLLLWHPLRFAAAAVIALQALPIRGTWLAVLLGVRLEVVGIGIAAGISLFRRGPDAVGLTRAALWQSAVMDLVIYSTSIFPNNRMPGDTPYYAAWSIAHHAGWLLYLRRSRRIYNTFTR